MLIDLDSNPMFFLPSLTLPFVKLCYTIKLEFLQLYERLLNPFSSISGMTEFLHIFQPKQHIMYDK